MSWFQAQASPAAISLIAQGDAVNASGGKMTESERQSLLALKAVVDGRLALETNEAAVSRNGEITPQPTPQNYQEPQEKERDTVLEKEIESGKEINKEIDVEMAL